MNGTKRALEAARHNGADRIYGWPVERAKPGPPLYALKAVDESGHCHFRRDLREEIYFAAVKFWMELTPPLQAMWWKRDAA